MASSCISNHQWQQRVTKSGGSGKNNNSIINIISASAKISKYQHRNISRK